MSENKVFMIHATPKFETGRFVITAGIDKLLRDNKPFHDFICESLERYVQCDWGDTCDEDKTVNDEALKTVIDYLPFTKWLLMSQSGLSLNGTEALLLFCFPMNISILTLKGEQMIFWKKTKKQKAVKKVVKLVSEKKSPQPKEKPKQTPLPKPKKQTAQTETKHLDAQKEFLRVFKQLTNNHRTWDIWRDFITMFACAISNSLDKAHYDKREKLYLRTIKKYNKREQNLFPELVAHTVMALEENPEQDFLGGIFMNLGLGNGSNGQFFTPYHVCDLMAKVAMGDGVVNEVKEKGYITINDSCCGAGATLIAGIHEVRQQLEKENLNFQNHVLIVAQDVDVVVALMCYIQISLLGVAGFVKVGNTLTDPICEGDSTENYWFTPMYFSDTWRMRRIFHQVDDVLKGES